MGETDDDGRQRPRGASACARRWNTAGVDVEVLDPIEPGDAADVLAAGAQAVIDSRFTQHVSNGADRPRRRTAAGRSRAAAERPGRAAADQNSCRPAHMSPLFRPWEVIDPLTLPPRDFIYGRHYIREFARVTLAPGGGSKSTISWASPSP